MLKDSLHDNWLYKEIYEEMRQESLEEGELKMARKNIELFTQHNFPHLMAPVRALIANEEDLEKLQVILLRIGTAKTTAELQDLLELPEQKNLTQE
jgi:hypothetical protein